MCVECLQTPAAAGLSDSVTRVSGGATWESSFLVKCASLPRTRQHQNHGRGGGPEPAPTGTREAQETAEGQQPPAGSQPDSFIYSDSSKEIMS